MDHYLAWLMSVTSQHVSNNQPCTARPTFIDSNPDEHNQGLRYYPFIINLDRCNGSCNTLDNPSGRICGPNKTEKVNLNAFTMITRVNESKTLKKYNSQQQLNNNKC